MILSTVTQSSNMNFTPEELEYLYNVLSTTSSYTIARAEQIDLPTVKHKKLQDKIKFLIERAHGH